MTDVPTTAIAVTHCYAGSEGAITMSIETPYPGEPELVRLHVVDAGGWHAATVYLSTAQAFLLADAARNIGQQLLTREAPE